MHKYKFVFYNLSTHVECHGSFQVGFSACDRVSVRDLLERRDVGVQVTSLCSCNPTCGESYCSRKLRSDLPSVAIILCVESLLQLCELTAVFDDAVRHGGGRRV